MSTTTKINRPESVDGIGVTSGQLDQRDGVSRAGGRGGGTGTADCGWGRSGGLGGCLPPFSITSLRSR